MKVNNLVRRQRLGLGNFFQVRAELTAVAHWKSPVALLSLALFFISDKQSCQLRLNVRAGYSQRVKDDGQGAVCWHGLDDPCQVAGGDFF